MTNIDKSTGRRDQFGWSVSTIQAYHVQNLVMRATSAYLAGKLDKLFWLLIAIRENIIYELLDKEIEALDNQEKVCNTASKPWHAVQKAIEEENSNPVEVFNARYQYSTEIRKFWREIMMCLKRIGLYTTRKDNTKMGF